TAASAVLGSREHRDQIVGLAEDSVLGRLGLIDADRFLAACRGPIDVVVEQHRVEPTLCCEAWVRTSKEVIDVPLGAWHLDGGEGAAARIVGRRSPKRIAAVLAKISEGARPATYAEASYARAVVTNTSLTCAAPKGCLPRSIATALLCRTHGSWPTWCVGVR